MCLTIQSFPSFSCSLPHSAHPLSFILPGQPFSFTNSILSTNKIPQWYGISQTSSFSSALPSGTELCIHPSDKLLFLTCTLLRTTPPSLGHGLQVSFYPRKQLLTLRFLQETLLSTSVSFSRSPATIPERSLWSLNVCQSPLLFGSYAPPVHKTTTPRLPSSWIGKQR